MKPALSSVAHYFVPQSVLQRLSRCPDSAQHTKKLAEVAVLFVDVQGCSTLCEVLPPPVMNRLLEMAFGDFFDCVQDAGGDINEIMGDGLMALFEGRSLRKSVDAAARAALAMQQHATTYRVKTDRSEVPFVVNMGCHAGRAFVGVTRFVGRYGERLTYTASGPVTHIAARLCALAHDGAILVSAATRAHLAAGYAFTPLGEHRLNNVAQAIAVYRLEGKYVPPASSPDT